MSILQTVLTFVVAPLAVVIVITGLAYAGGARRARRYRPGRPFDFTPVWFLSAPEQLSSVDSAAPLPAAPHRAELTAGARPAADVAQAAAPGGSAATAHGETGGASDRW